MLDEPPVAPMAVAKLPGRETTAPTERGRPNGRWRTGPVEGDSTRDHEGWSGTIDSDGDIFVTNSTVL